jgi:uncharacterized repeat protein (TIGR01451 family)
MNRQTDQRSSAHPRRSKVLIEHTPRPMLVAAAMIAIFLLTLSLTVIFSPRSSVRATTESIFTSAAGCVNPQPNNTWNLGGTICATATGSPQPVNGFRQRRFQWVAPNGSVAQQTDVTASPQNDTYTVPMSGGFAQAGTWRVQTVDNDGGISSEARFTLRDQAHASADLSVSKYGPIKATAGSNITYTVSVTNQGPDDAQDVVLSDTVPANTTFVSETQLSGPTFTCPGDTPPCTISTLAVGATATFSLTYDVITGTPVETVISNTASVSSSTAELFQPDNSSSFQTTVTSASTTCTINCPSDITQDVAQCSAVVSYTTPTTSGSCGSPPDSDVLCNPPSGSVFPTGVTLVNCGTQTGGLCSFSVTVHDTRTSSPPTINCPGNVTASEDSPGSGSASVNYTAPATTGNCVTAVCTPPSGSRFSFGTTTVNCTAKDSSNQTAACSFTVTINASTCRINCPDDKTVNESSPGSGSATVSYSTPSTIGSCPSLTIACNPTSGSSFPVGITQVNCTATDQSSVLVATCSFTVTVNGSSACSITCPLNIIAGENPSGSGSATVNYPSPTPSGNCSTIPCNPPSGTSFPIGTTTVFCSATDPAGNGVSCSFTVTVTGGTPCTITCPSVAPQPSDVGGCTTVVTYPNPVTSGSCGDPANPHPWSCNPPSGSVFPVGTITVTCSTDVGTSCSFPVTVTGTDAVAPVITTCAGPNFVLADSNCQGVVPNVTSDVDATDNCTPTALLTVTQNPAAGTLVGTGTTTITVTVKDANNNSTTCTTTFMVFEPTPPTALCQPYTAVLDATGHASVTAANVDNGSTDNCAIASRTVTPSTFTCANKGSNTVTLTVTDPSGNSASCQTTVTVVDTTPPTISCPANITKSNDPGQCSAIVTYANATATDNCSGVGTPICTPTSGSTFPKGTTTVTCTVSDASSNSASCAFTVTVNDTQPPTISCPANITKSTDPGLCSAVVTYANATAADNCSGVGTPVCTPASGSTFQKGTTTVTCTVSDASGNSSSCAFTVTVNDTQPPTIACVADIIADFDPAVNGAVVTYTTPVGSDNCPGAVTARIAGLASGATFPAGTTTNTFRVTDTSGLTAQCSFKVTVALTSIIGLDSVSISGASLVDSYNSTGGYPATQGSLANVLSNGTITLGNSGRVMGNVRSTRAGVAMSGASQVTGNATAGTTVSRSGSATVGGTITNNQLAPVMTMPSVAACGAYSSNSGITGTYTYNQSTGDLSLSGVNIATLANGTYCFHNITLTNSAQLKVNGLVVIKLTGTLNVSGATSFTNTTGSPGNLRILSSYTGTTGVTLGNSSNVYLVIYAPGTGVSISGAAPLFGTVVGKTVTIGNSGMIHYDTQLKNIWPDIWSLIP